ncbi:MAG: hypothetical protein ABSF69_08635 [Polyangiaceae bacterium]
MSQSVRVSIGPSNLGALATVGAIVACFACGGGSSGGTGAGSGNATPGACSLAAGTYTSHSVLQSGSSAGCPILTDQSVPITGSESASSISAFMTSTTSGADGGATCTTSQSGCTVMETCSDSSAGATSQVTVNFTVANDSASGQETIQEMVTESGVAISVTCTYAITLTQT